MHQDMGHLNHGFKDDQPFTLFVASPSQTNSETGADKGPSAFVRDHVTSMESFSQVDG